MATLNIGAAEAGASFDQPFDLLAACHERVERSLALLGRIVAHVSEHGCDEQARGAATDVLRYFDIAAPLHHQDEERHVFPLLECQGDPRLAAVAQRLRADHLQITAAWAELRTLLLSVAAGAAGVPAELPQLAQRFIDLHTEHLSLEDGCAFVQARAQLDEAAMARMGEEMALRRGVVRARAFPRR